eukprot:3668656-Rhodomonas_salina.1
MLSVLHTAGYDRVHLISNVSSTRCHWVYVGLHLQVGMVEIYDSLHLQTAQSTLSVALCQEFEAADLATPRVLLLDGPAQEQGLDCFGFAALALCCSQHDRPIRFTAGEALQCRAWVASILVEAGAP